MLQLLGRSGDVHSIQPCLKKCFDSIHDLQLSEKPGAQKSIIAVISGDGEVLPLCDPVYPTGPVEQWLAELEVTVQKSIQKILHAYLSGSKKYRVDRWMETGWPFQVMMLGTQISTTHEIAKILDGLSTPSLHDLRKHAVQTIGKIVTTSRNPTGVNERKSLSALATLEMHNRDVVESLIRNDVKSSNDLIWQRQLRYKYHSETQSCRVLQGRNEFAYGFEYLGITGRLVVTPLLERCYQAVLTSMSYYKGVSVYGPAGTGKSETVKEIAKGLGKFVVLQVCLFSMTGKLTYRTVQIQ